MCPFNKDINCNDRHCDNDPVCNKCGWNPEVEKLRKKAARDKLVAGGGIS